MRIDKSDNLRERTFSRRSVLIATGCFGIFGGLTTRLYQLQVVDSDKYHLQAEENRMNRQIVPPLRGRIFDRFGREIASNRENFRVILVPEQTDDVEATLARLGAIVPISEKAWDQAVRQSRSGRAFVPVTVAENVTWQEFARINVELPDLPGVQPEVGMTRYYPFGTDLGHVVGYVAEPSKAEVEASDDPLLRVPGFHVGKAGIERVLDDELRGQKGVSLVEVNAYGRIIRELSRTDGTQGKDVTLTLDLDLQRIAAERIRDESAAVVVMDVQNGDIITMVSSPGFDPNEFNVGITQKSWSALIADEKKPLLNKIINGLYPPGSTFKMTVALAALAKGVSPKTRNHCSGSVRLGAFEFHCWKKGGHGSLDMSGAIKNSCNVYFYELGKRIGIQPIADMCHKLGLGEPTGIEIPGEKAGLVPDPVWKRATFEEPWHPGETLNTAIGQGYLQVSPVQMATMLARMANGGLAVRPHLVRYVGDKLVVPKRQNEPLQIPPEHISLVLDAMNRVVNEPGGTAYRSRIEDAPVAMGGKTGTVQVRRISREERIRGVIKNEDLPWRQRDHGWFVGYGPVGAPRYSIAVLVEHGGGGSKAAAPVAKDVMRAVLLKNPSALPTPTPEPMAVSQREEPPATKTEPEGI